MSDVQARPRHAHAGGAESPVVRVRVRYLQFDGQRRRVKSVPPNRDSVTIRDTGEVESGSRDGLLLVSCDYVAILVEDRHIIEAGDTQSIESDLGVVAHAARPVTHHLSRSDLNLCSREGSTIIEATRIPVKGHHLACISILENTVREGVGAERVGEDPEVVHFWRSESRTRFHIDGVKAHPGGGSGLVIDRGFKVRVGQINIGL